MPTTSAGAGYLSGFFPMPLESVDTAQLDSLLPGVTATAHLTLHYRPGVLASADLDAFAADAEDAVAHITGALGLGLAQREDIYLAYTFFPPPDPGVKGYTLPGDHVILLMIDGSGTRQERQYMVAHELTHQIAHDGLGQAATIMLSEGLAMDMEQKYMLQNGDVSLDGFARAALEQGQLIPLTELSDGSVGFLGQLFYRRPYDEAGSFVHYLITLYGVAPFERVYVSGDYAGVYGKTLSALAAEWTAYLQSPQAQGPLAPDSASYMNGIEEVQAGYAGLFNALSSGKTVPLWAYQALDAARTAADRADEAGMAQGIAVFARAVPPASP